MTFDDNCAMLKDFSHLIVIIPAYQPSEELVRLVHELLPFQYQQIIVINDGSDASKDELFQRVATLSQVRVLTHSENKGKGAALSTGFSYVLENYSDILGVVTADADGQHIPTDIAKVATTLLSNLGKLILGVRQFDPSVPLRSRFGNNLTRALFHWRYHLEIQDTQTGLRGIPTQLLQLYTTIALKRYEFEMACLIVTVRKEYQIIQVPIQTVYFNQNAASHFHPLIDSIRIYYIFLRFSIGRK